ncbi:MAG: proprotein convertase P-domain-containing protein [bacterium]|nr:proprotein convertase P-domain-containing protein [bacterium]
MRTLFSLICLVAACIQSANAQRTIVYTSENVPVAIPDGPAGIVESTLGIAEYYWIIDVNVIVSITHTFDQDLRIYIEAPNEEVVRLAYECGQSNDNYTNTRFDDEASTGICSGNPPFTGSFRPDHPLDLFDGMFTHGTWTLRVTDNWHGDTGILQAWRMEVTIDTTVSAHEPPLATTFSVGQNYPNPFNATTILPLELGYPSLVKLTVYSIDGRTVQQSLLGLTAGHHDLPIDGSNWSTGNYFAEIIAGKNQQTVRMLLLK